MTALLSKRGLRIVLAALLMGAMTSLAAADPITVEGLTFSDELGNFRLVSVTGTGTLNDPFVVQQAGLFARRALAAPRPTAADRIAHMYLLALGRPLSSAETEHALALVQSGRARLLAVAGDVRVPLAPDVPTVIEAGVPCYEATIWLGLMAPIGTPKPIIDKLNAAVNEAVKRPDIVKLWTQQGAVPMSMTPEEFDKFLRGDIVKWAEVVKKFDKPQ